MPASLTRNDTGGRSGEHVADMQRRRLMLAITEVVGGRGLEAATVGRVCERAGVSRRTFYELFEDREACLLAAFDHAVEQISDRAARAARPAAGRWSERVREGLIGVLELLDVEPETARMCVIETLRAGPAVLEHRRTVTERLIGIVDQGRGASRAGAQAPPLTAQGIVGGALAVMHDRLLAAPCAEPGLVELTGPLMAMIVHPYLGAAAARKELERPAPAPIRTRAHADADPFKGLPIRFTYRTARVLATIAADPGASNRYVANNSGVADEGQMSRLLRRLEGFGLIENGSTGHARGEPNAWRLTGRGAAIQAVIATRAAGP